MKKIREYPQTKIKISEIKLDGDNPNVMTDSEQKRLKGSLEEFGSTDDIVVDSNTMILADGEHRLKEFLDAGEEEVFVKLVPFKDDLHRRAYRQAKNKISGTHDKLLDMKEYKLLLDADRSDLLEMATGKTVLNIKNHMRRVSIERSKVKKSNKCPRCGYEY